MNFFKQKFYLIPVVNFQRYEIELAIASKYIILLLFMTRFTKGNV
jgi:hypothetical protein